MPQSGVLQKCVVDAHQAKRRVRERARFFFLMVETRRFGTYQNWLGYILDTYECAPALCLEAVPEGYPPPQYPPYSYSSFSTAVALPGWHLCRTKLPRNVVNSKAKSEAKCEMKGSKNAPRRLQNLLCVLPLPNSLSPALFHHSFAPAISNKVSILVSRRESAGMATLIVY